MRKGIVAAVLMAAAVCIGGCAGISGKRIAAGSVLQPPMKPIDLSAVVASMPGKSLDITIDARSLQPGTEIDAMNDSDFGPADAARLAASIASRGQRTGDPVEVLDGLVQKNKGYTLNIRIAEDSALVAMNGQDNANRIAAGPFTASLLNNVTATGIPPIIVRPMPIDENGNVIEPGEPENPEEPDSGGEEPPLPPDPDVTWNGMPPPPAPNAGDPGGIDERFLWKPNSDHGNPGDARILLPQSLTADRVTVNGDPVAISTSRGNGRWNGNRQHFRPDQPGQRYPANTRVVATYKGNTVGSWTVPNPGQRYTKKLDPLPVFQPEAPAEPDSDPPAPPPVEEPITRLWIEEESGLARRGNVLHIDPRLNVRYRVNYNKGGFGPRNATGPDLFVYGRDQPGGIVTRCPMLPGKSSYQIIDEKHRRTYWGYFNNGLYRVRYHIPKPIGFEHHIFSRPRWRLDWDRDGKTEIYELNFPS